VVELLKPPKVAQEFKYVQLGQNLQCQSASPNLQIKFWYSLSLLSTNGINGIIARSKPKFSIGISSAGEQGLPAQP
jgi:hypothetical protein